MSLACQAEPTPQGGNETFLCTDEPHITWVLGLEKNQIMHNLYSSKILK